MDDSGFDMRRKAARVRLDALPGAMSGSGAERHDWFHAVYETADDDPAGVPWADLEPKPELVDWLNANPGSGGAALDIACGLGDNAEALAAAGYQTAAFDLVGLAVTWARRRFPETSVDYRVADLFDPPADWFQAFDLVHECYTVQALHGDLRAKAFEAIANFVKPGGRLLVITRTQPEDGQMGGPPWPLRPSELRQFEELSLILEDLHANTPIRADGRTVPYARLVYRRSQSG